MKPRILYFKGAASHAQQIDSEQTHFLESVKSLEESGAEVIKIGDAHNGFSWDITQAHLKEHKNVSAIIVNVHGNIDDDRHLMCMAENQFMWAENFYKAVSDNSNGHSVNIFMFSCGSGNGLKQAQKILPHRSTIFSLTTPEEVDSHWLDPKGFAISGDHSIANPIEGLFLNLICNALPNEWRCDPHLTITSGVIGKKNIIELWGKATGFCCEHSGFDFPEQYINEARELLRPYLSGERIVSALATMEYYKKEVLRKRAALEHPDVPFVAHHALDTEDFKSEVVGHRLLGPIGAMAYGIYRDEWGAFQRPIIDTLPPTLDL